MKQQGDKASLLRVVPWFWIFASATVVVGTLLVVSLFVMVSVGRTAVPPGPRPSKYLIEVPATATRPARISVATRPANLRFEGRSMPSEAELRRQYLAAGWDEARANSMTAGMARAPAASTFRPLLPAQLTTPPTTRRGAAFVPSTRLDRPSAAATRGSANPAGVSGRGQNEYPFRAVPVQNIRASDGVVQQFGDLPGTWRITLMPLGIDFNYLTLGGYRDAFAARGRSRTDGLDALYDRTPAGPERDLVREAITRTDIETRYFFMRKPVGDHSSMRKLIRQSPGFYLVGSRSGFGISYFVPLPPFLFLGLVATAVAWRFRRRCRRSGHCANCGYDLRASQGRCPECGVAIVAATPASEPG